MLRQGGLTNKLAGFSKLAEREVLRHAGQCTGLADGLCFHTTRDILRLTQEGSCTKLEFHLFGRGFFSRSGTHVSTLERLFVLVLLLLLLLLLLLPCLFF